MRSGVAFVFVAAAGGAGGGGKRRHCRRKKVVLQRVGVGVGGCLNCPGRGVSVVQCGVIVVWCGTGLWNFTNSNVVLPPQWEPPPTLRKGVTWSIWPRIAKKTHLNHPLSLLLRGQNTC